MRIPALVIIGGTLAACTSSVTVPREQVIVEVPASGIASTAGGEPLVAGEGRLADGTLAMIDPVTGLPPRPTPLDADRINPMDYTLAQQRYDAAVAEQQLAAARSQLVVIQPEALPNRVEGVNIALYAQQSTNAVGQRVYRRSGGGIGGCGRYRSPDDAQRAFLASGGPDADPLGLDRDGDGFACSWDPTPYRQLRL
jgi:hypothetical protein